MGGAIQNELLAAMPRKAYEALAPALVPVTLVFGDVLYAADAPLTHVYFPCESMVSLLLPVEHHLDVEVGMVGREGMLGASQGVVQRTYRHARNPYARSDHARNSIA